MVTKDQLKELLHIAGLSKKDQLLVCLACDAKSPKAVKEIKILANSGGLRSSKNWNISSMLSRTESKAIRVDNGWELSATGKKHLQKLLAPYIGKETVKVANTLRVLLPKIKKNQTKHFVEEAITCFENNLFRAAVVLSWVGAVSILYDHVIANHLAAFNLEAKKRNPKWKQAKNIEDLSRLKEADFSIILESSSVIGKSVKQELETCLRFRNGCGHPNNLKIGESRVSAHIESLVLNVYSKFIQV